MSFTSYKSQKFQVQSVNVQCTRVILFYWPLALYNITFESRKEEKETDNFPFLYFSVSILIR